MEVERGRLRRIFGKVAAVVGVIATVAFYALGFQIGAAYVQDYQNSKAPETSISMVEQQASPTANLPWAAAGAAMAVSYGAGFAAIAAGKKRDRYGYSGSSYSGSSSNDGFFWGYMFGSSGNSGGSSRSSSSSDSKGAAAAIVIVGAAAIAAGATVVNYKGVRANFFTGEEPLKKKRQHSCVRTVFQGKHPRADARSEARTRTVDPDPRNSLRTRADQGNRHRPRACEKVETLRDIGELSYLHIINARQL